MQADIVLSDKDRYIVKGSLLRLFGKKNDKYVGVESDTFYEIDEKGNIVESGSLK